MSTADPAPMCTSSVIFSPSPADNHAGEPTMKAVLQSFRVGVGVTELFRAKMALRIMMHLATLFLLGCIPDSGAWMPQRHRPKLSKDSTKLFSSIDGDDPSSFSRRSWLRNVAAGTSASAACLFGSTGAQAADYDKRNSICDQAVSVWKKDSRLVRRTRRFEWPDRIESECP